jgi:AraC-like DNA-binding protein
MKAVNYTIPIVKKASYVIKEEQLESFYPHLHRHRQVQICWIKKGKGDLVCEGTILPFKSNDTFIIASNVAHLFMNEKTSGVKTLSLFLEVDEEFNPLMKIPELRETCDILKKLRPCTRLDQGINPLLQKLLQSGEPNNLSVLIDLLAFVKVTTMIQSNSYVPFSEKSGDRMQIILQYTIENLASDLKIKDVADQIAYTPEAFCRFFKKRTGKTFITYLNEIRITEACQRILYQENSDIGSIAYGCGFNNVSHFNRIFKKLKGCSPLQFRKNYQTKERIVA